ncbi:cytochrome c [Aristophania vespae]|uniref:cytochrome c n=1 Tax=Aristophania vespae TaxID=2697033 RepID=UPI00235152D2|nr:cytochrome c [Aristophania vespae]UMM63846.1 Fructose dehydrogenase cytochrome subunit [Aristophania vespae]
MSKKNLFISLLALPLSLMTLGPAVAQTAPQSNAVSENALIARGQYLAHAGDCAACHTVSGHKLYSGGYSFHMPMGEIVSGNITSSKKFGIGTWSEKDFANAVRKGILPNGRHLYPAMPYTAYANITDDDIHALYVYFQHVPAVETAPEKKSQLKFPFNLPGLMTVWNFLYAKQQPFQPDPTLNSEENRGKYLVEGLGHCSTCHTPRNQMLSEDMGKFLTGAYVQNWHAPNITSDAVSGIGGWSDQELFSYLKTGRAVGKSQAGGPMAEAIVQSFQYLTDHDIKAIISYLRKVPAVRTPGQTSTSWSVTKPKEDKWNHYETGGSKNDQPGYRDISTLNGAMLYNNNCAACHGINGEGSEDHIFPSLTQNSAVGADDPTNLVMSIYEGIHRQGVDYKAVMPAFSQQYQAIHNWLSPAQIAAISNYVTERFGQGNAHLKAADVNYITSRATDTAPFLIRNAAILAAIGIVTGVVILILLFVMISKSRRRP